MTVPHPPQHRWRPVAAVLPGIFLHLIISAVAGLVVYFMRFAAAGCGETGRVCNFVVIGLGQNYLVYIVPAIWVLTAAAAMSYAAIQRRSAQRIVVIGIIASVIYLLIAAALTLVGAYVL